jgi:hypothetical protein
VNLQRTLGDSCLTFSPHTISQLALDLVTTCGNRDRSEERQFRTNRRSHRYPRQDSDVNLSGLNVPHRSNPKEFMLDVWLRWAEEDVAAMGSGSRKGDPSIQSGWMGGRGSAGNFTQAQSDATQLLETEGTTLETTNLTSCRGFAECCLAKCRPAEAKAEKVFGH